MPEHIVQQGECFSSIAYNYGFYWETIWTRPENTKLVCVRKDPNVLLPGDIVYIPEKEPKEYSAQTDKRHTFVLKGVPALLRLRLLHEGEPLSNVEYSLVIDGKFSSGTTDGDGRIQTAIPPDARKGHLILHLDDGMEEYPLDLGAIDPADVPSGLRARLHNLGYDVEPLKESKDLDPHLSGALSAFQRDHHLQVTGRPDESTVKKIKEIFGG